MATNPLNEQAVKIAMKIIKQFEGCNLHGYPDPASPLYKALSLHGKLQAYMAGKLKWNDLADNFKTLSGAPFTVGYGQTGMHITKDTVWTEQEALQALESEVRKVMVQCLKDCPKLVTLSPERIAAVTSLAYNIGGKAFRDSTACRKIKEESHADVPAAIKMFNKAGGLIVQGLVNRRKVEADLYASTK